MLKFAHLADCHIGSWRDPKLTELNFLSFSSAIDTCIFEKVDFVLIAGDLFNTSMPSLDYVNRTVKEFVKLKKKGIKVFLIAGSHDFSPSGKTMLKVFDSAGLVINVLKGNVIDGKLQLNVIEIPSFKLQITGILGKKGTLEKYYYEAIDHSYLLSSLKEDYLKIFMFHSALTEIKPKELSDMPSSPVSVLPKGFDYYAGGHVHYRFYNEVDDLGLVVYPGPTFPNNFKELSDLRGGSFQIITYSDGKFSNVEKLINLKDVYLYNKNLKDKLPLVAKTEILSDLDNLDLKDKLVLLRFYGTLNGSVDEIDFRSMMELINSKEPFVVLKNSFMLKSRDEEIAKLNVDDIDNVESKLIKENFDDVDYVFSLIEHLSSEKQEGETNSSYEDRVIDDILKIIS